MPKILLAGDSWGIGSYAFVNNNYTLISNGIESILTDKSYQVKNISQAGCSNNTIYSNLLNSDLSTVDHVIFLQTDAFRDNCYWNGDLKVLHKEFINKLQTYSKLEEYFVEYFSNLYSNLNSLGKTVLCVGGWGQLHPLINNYSNLKPILPSVTKFLVPELEEDSYLSDFEWFNQLNDDHEFVKKFDVEYKELAVKSMNKFNMCCEVWNDVHPTHIAYKLVVEEITKYFKGNI